MNEEKPAIEKPADVAAATQPAVAQPNPQAMNILTNSLPESSAEKRKIP